MTKQRKYHKFVLFNLQKAENRKFIKESPWVHFWISMWVTDEAKWEKTSVDGRTPAAGWNAHKLLSLIGTRSQPCVCVTERSSLTSGCSPSLSRMKSVFPEGLLNHKHLEVTLLSATAAACYIAGLTGDKVSEQALPCCSAGVKQDHVECSQVCSAQIILSELEVLSGSDQCKTSETEQKWTGMPRFSSHEAKLINILKSWTAHWLVIIKRIMIQVSLKDWFTSSSSKAVDADRSDYDISSEPNRSN